MSPINPNFKPGVGHLVTDRYDFQKHIDGEDFRQDAGTVDLNPTILIGSTIIADVQTAIEALAGSIIVPSVPDATTVSKGIIQLNGDLFGNGTTALNPRVSGLQGTPITVFSGLTSNQVLTWNGSAWQNLPVPGTISIAGDLAGVGSTLSVPRVGGLQGFTVSSATPTTGQALVWSGSAWVPTGIPTSPTGTGFATLTGGTYDAAATANIRYTGGKFQSSVSVQYINGGITGDLAWTPTASNKTLTLPNATDTLVGQSTTDTLINKNINATNNTITDTGTATGDLLLSNGTKFVKLVKGPNGSFLGVSGGVVGYYTPSSSTPAGTGFAHITGGVYDGTATANIRYAGAKFQTDVNIQFKTAGQLGDLAWPTITTTRQLTLPDANDTLVGKATTDVFTNKTFNVAGTGNLLTSTSQATGDLLKNNGTQFLRFAKGSALQVLRVNAGATDLEWAAVSSGASSSGAAGVVQASNGAGGFQTTTILDNGVNIKTALPLAGNLSSSLPFRFKVCRITLAGELAYTMTASQYECPIIIVSGVTDAGSSYLEVPLSDGGWFCVHNKTDGAIDIRPAGGGSSLDISVTNKSAIAWYDQTLNKVRGVVSSVLS